MTNVWSKWAPLPLRLIIGFGFVYDGFPKLFSAGGHEMFVGNSKQCTQGDQAISAGERQAIEATLLQYEKIWVDDSFARAVVQPPPNELDSAFLKDI